MVKLIAVVLLPFIAFVGFMYMKQPDMVFFPLKELRDAPGNWGLDYENVNITSLDKTADLNGWFIPKHGASKTLLFFHGNAGNISHRGDSIRIFNDAGVNVLIIDYRGYGISTGTPSERGLYDDARSAWHYLTVIRGIPEKDIIIFGRSLGGVVATQLGSEVSAAGLIIESVFSSAKDVARKLMPYLSYLVYVRYSFDAAETIKKVKMPVLVLHSPADDIIPFSMGKRVFDSANEPKTFYEMRGDHNSGFIESQPEYQRELEKFIASLNVQ
jgi:fermentation-respiration switch protein FrsA (DUF1100 family)